MGPTEDGSGSTPTFPRRVEAACPLQGATRLPLVPPLVPEESALRPSGRTDVGSRRTQLTSDVDALVVAYVSGIGLTAAAEAAGMSKQTAWRRLQTGEVRQLIADTKAAHRASVLDWADAVRSLADLVTDAVVTVLGL